MALSFLQSHHNVIIQQAINMSTRSNTLEGHLMQFNNQKEKSLSATWIVNKEKLSHVLSLISSSFPTYSAHDASHSDTIIENIERLLGNNIKKLGATDTFMLLMAAYTHDLGMYLSYKTIEEKWNEEGFAKKINELENHRDYQIAQAARLLRETRNLFNKPTRDNNDTRDEDKDSMLWALEIKNAVTLLTIELFRDEHAIRSKNYLNDYSEFEKLLENIQQYGGMKATLAKIAYLHYEDFNKIFILDKAVNGYTGSGDVFHPRFVACMLRLGDLLDFDSNRFNKFAMAMVKEVPETSLVHYRKHCSTKNETSIVSPTEIKVTFNCYEDVDFRETEKWKKMVEREFKNMHSYWAEISPLDQSNRTLIQLPSANQINIKLKYRGDENPNPDLINLKFDISSKKTFEMLKGGAIYKNPGRVFLREIVQNALDATKLQIWHDLKEGHYLPLHLENPGRDIKTINDIKFSDDIPSHLFDNYPIHLQVQYDNEKNIIRFICEDYGTGISEESLIRMTSKVGESRKADKDYETNLKEMPYFLQPTAAFGLGLQTIFYVANEFKVETCCADNTSRFIIFRSSINGSYCSMENKETTMHRGTKVIIEIDEDHFGRLFELDDNDTKELSNNPESIEYYIPKLIDDYVQYTFQRSENIPFNYQSPFCSFSSKRTSEENFKHIKDETDFRLSYIINKNRIVFRIDEKKFGSIIKLIYRNKLIISGSEKLLKAVFTDYPPFSIKGVPVDYEYSLPFIGANHVELAWDLLCRTADTIVTISRDDLLPYGYSWCTNTMNELMPDIIRLTQDPLSQELEKHTNNTNKKIADSIRQQYCSLCLVDWQMPQPIIKDYSPITNLKLPHNVSVKQLLTTPDIIALDSYNDNNPQIESFFNIKNSSIFCWGELTNSIPNSYICNKIQYVSMDKNSDLGIWAYYLKKASHSKTQTIKMTSKDFAFLFKTCCKYRTTELLPGIKQYDTIAVCKAPLLGFNHYFHYNCWIYPINWNEFRKIREVDITMKEYAKKLESDWIQKLVPDHVVKLIQKYNIHNNQPTKDEIYKVYIRLILDVNRVLQKLPRRDKG